MPDSPERATPGNPARDAPEFVDTMDAVEECLGRLIDSMKRPDGESPVPPSDETGSASQDEAEAEESWHDRPPMI
jgi:hypothetical protein